MEAREIEVRVSGWQNRRQVIEEETRVLFEVTVDESHCPICAERMRHIREVLDQKDIKAEFIRRNNNCRELVTFVAIPPRPQDMRLASYVAITLELPIRT